MKKCAATLLSTILSAACASALAGVVVTIDNVVQHFPYDGNIDITYTVGGVADPADYELKFHCIEGAATNALATFASAPSAANGTRTVSWNAAADGVAVSSGRADFLADIHTKVPFDGDYMVIDVSGGPNAESFPVTYVSGVADPAATFNVDEYKLGKIVLKKVRAGTFLMGSPEDEVGRNTCLYYTSYLDGGEDLHYVRLTDDFFLGIFPVTGCQFTNVCDCAIPGNAYSGTNRADVTVRPAGTINWDNHLYGGTCFFDRINSRVLWNGMGRPSLGLPTESQWEYACRAGTTTAYFFGADATDFNDYCWISKSFTQPVGGKLPNPWGFYDMAGNVYQYCADKVGPYPPGTLEEPAVNPVHSYVSHNVHVLRGAGYSGESKVEYARSAARMAGVNLNRADNGFRLLANVIDPAEFTAKVLLAGVVIDASSTQTDINAATLTLLTNRVEYTGAAVAAPISLSYDGRTLALGTDYSLSYSDNVNLGVCTAMVAGLGDFAGTRIARFRIVSPCVATSPWEAAKVDLRDDDVLQVIVPKTLFNLAYNNADGWPQGGEASETVKAVVSAAPMETAASVPAEGDFETVISSDGEGSVKWRPKTRFTMVRLQIARDGVVDPECTVTRVFESTFSAFMMIVR